MSDEEKVQFIEQLKQLRDELEKKTSAPVPCPGCGRCPTCGRGGYWTNPYYVPGYPYSEPYKITWGPYTGTITYTPNSITVTSGSHS